MGSPSANSADVVFAFDEALQAARELYALSNVVEEKLGSWAAEAGKIVEPWNGRHADHFDANLKVAGTIADAIKSGLRKLADKFAESWAQARGEQDRINFARWVQAQKDDDWWGEDVVDFVYEEDHGAPPENPPTPTHPYYFPTRDPVHPEYENRSEFA